MHVSIWKSQVRLVFTMGLKCWRIRLSNVSIMCKVLPGCVVGNMGALSPASGMALIGIEEHLLVDWHMLWAPWGWCNQVSLDFHCVVRLSQTNGKMGCTNWMLYCDNASILNLIFIKAWIWVSLKPVCQRSSSKLHINITSDKRLSYMTSTFRSHLSWIVILLSKCRASE